MVPEATIQLTVEHYEQVNNLTRSVLNTTIADVIDKLKLENPQKHQILNAFSLTDPVDIAH